MKPSRSAVAAILACIVLSLTARQAGAECHHAAPSGTVSAGIPGSRAGFSPLDLLGEAVKEPKRIQSGTSVPEQVPETPCLRCQHTPISVPSPTVPRLTLSDDLIAEAIHQQAIRNYPATWEDVEAHYLSHEDDVPVPPPRDPILSGS
ncbi:MAG: hypothetical protein NZM31_08585 [Gemmatales bacterium]|nr:hypothetical protein [Gemmatales bacterium]MDW8387048.1 hypothetical protein [Gemmatales bacterium]